MTKPKKMQKVKTTTKTTNHDGYNKTHILKEKNGQQHQTITFNITDDKKFDAQENLKNIQKRMEDKFNDKRFYIKIYGPMGWKTVGGNNGLHFQDYEEYFDGKVQDPDKFISDVDAITIDIR